MAGLKRNPLGELAAAETARNLQGNASVAGNAAPLLSSRRKRLSRGSQPVIALRAPDVSLIQLGRCQPCLPFVDRVKAQPKTGAAAPASRGVSASRGHEIADPSRSRTVLETRISPVPARAETRAAVCGAAMSPRRAGLRPRPWSGPDPSRRCHADARLQRRARLLPEQDRADHVHHRSRGRTRPARPTRTRRWSEAGVTPICSVEQGAEAILTLAASPDLAGRNANTTVSARRAPMRGRTIRQRADD